MPEMKRNVKDSVFTLMFREPQYALQLYQSLHPEDKDATEADCKIVTLENILTVGQYNDLGLLVRDLLLMLTEAQSIFTLNIAPRLLMYVANSYREFVDERDLDLYSTKPVKLPRPELYVVYTGSEANVPDTIHLSDLYEGTGDVDICVHVIRRTGTRDILDQYVRFCEIVDENRRKYGRTAEAVEKILQQCREEDILTPFLTSRQKEVHDIMVTLFDQEKVLKTSFNNVARAAEEKGEERGMEKGIHVLVSTLKGLAVAPAVAIQALVERFDLPQDVAEQKVRQYWA